MAVLAVTQLINGVQDSPEIIFDLQRYPQNTPEELLTWKEQRHQADGFATVRQAGGRRVRAEKTYPDGRNKVRIFQVR